MQFAKERQTPPETEIPRSRTLKELLTSALQKDFLTPLYGKSFGEIIEGAENFGLTGQIPIEQQEIIKKAAFEVVDIKRGSSDNAPGKIEVSNLKLLTFLTALKTLLGPQPKPEQKVTVTRI